MLLSNSPKQDCPPCPKGSPMWMATFADMATLLMAFFVLLVAFANMDPAGSYRQTDEHEKGPGVLDDMLRIQSPGGDLEIWTQASSSTQLLIEGSNIAPDKDSEFTGDELINSAMLMGNKDYTNNADMEALEKALALEIAAGMVRLVEKPEAIIVQVATYDPRGIDGKGRQLDSISKISKEDVLVYAKVAEIQGAAKTDIVVENMNTSVSINNQEDIVKEASFADRYQRIYRQMSAAIAQGTVSVVRDGQKVVIRIAGSASFVSGRAALRPAIRPLLDQLARVLVGTEGKITVEGHTDNRPLAFNEIYRSNWDLSSARAAAVAGYFVAKPELANEKFMVSGLAAIHPVASNITVSGRALNRRIEIIVDDNE